MISCLIASYNSHVAKTGDIKDFVIAEESGIAKGIRRIVAVTGHEAQEMIRLAQDFKARIDHIPLLSSKEQDVAMKTLSVVSPFILSSLLILPHLLV